MDNGINQAEITEAYCDVSGKTAMLGCTTNNAVFSAINIPSLTCATSQVITSCSTTSAIGTAITAKEFKGSVFSQQGENVLGAEYKNGQETSVQQNNTMKPTDQTVVTMLQHITVQLKTIQNDVKSLKDNKKHTAEQLESLQFDMEDDHEQPMEQQRNLWSG